MFQTPINYRTLTKQIVKAVVGISTGYTVSNALANNVNPDSTFHKAEVVIGSAACGYVAADVVGNWTDKQLDSLFDAFGYRQDDDKEPESTPTWR